jgi:hypothetical protein
MDWLVPAGKINDGKAAHADLRVRGSVNTLIVRPAMRDEATHRIRNSDIR